MTDQTVDLGYRPRSAFVPFHTRRQRWACIVAHRRAGKTVACIMDLIDAALRCKRAEGRFAYVAPFYAQAKDVAWSYLKQYALAIQGAAVNESELRVDFPNGARVRLYGADNYDRMRGIYLDGVILDEYADMDQRAWPEVLRPALSDRKGWAVFIGTPRGRDDFCRVYTDAVDSPEWFDLKLKASQSGIIPEAELADARKSMTEDAFEQEYECSFDAAIVGAVYGKQIVDLENDGRLTGVPVDPVSKVWTAWDLGIGDSTAIWFAQMVGREIHMIDYLEASGESLSYYVREIDKRGYLYGGHIVPHDANARELGTGKTRIETLNSLGLNAKVCHDHTIDDGINAVRLALPRMWFDKVKCSSGVNMLKQYRFDYDAKNRVLRTRPVHNHASHCSDALRYLCMGIDHLSPNIIVPRRGSSASRGGWMGA